MVVDSVPPGRLFFKRLFALAVQLGGDRRRPLSLSAPQSMPNCWRLITSSRSSLLSLLSPPTFFLLLLLLLLLRPFLLLPPSPPRSHPGSPHHRRRRCVCLSVRRPAHVDAVSIESEFRVDVPLRSCADSAPFSPFPLSVLLLLSVETSTGLTVALRLAFLIVSLLLALPGSADWSTKINQHQQTHRSLRWR